MPRDRDDYDDDDDDDDRPRRRRQADDGGIDNVIPFRNVLALVSYYMGVFGLLTCFIFGVGGLFGIVPVSLGVLGLMKASKDSQARGRVHGPLLRRPWVGDGCFDLRRDRVGITRLGEPNLSRVEVTLDHGQPRGDGRQPHVDVLEQLHRQQQLGEVVAKGRNDSDMR